MNLVSAPLWLLLAKASLAVRNRGVRGGYHSRAWGLVSTSLFTSCNPTVLDMSDQGSLHGWRQQFSPSRPALSCFLSKGHLGSSGPVSPAFSLSPHPGLNTSAAEGDGVSPSLANRTRGRREAVPPTWEGAGLGHCVNDSGPENRHFTKQKPVESAQTTGLGSTDPRRHEAEPHTADVLG